ncbi:hypothetical protein [Corallococcus sp. NCRR]|uniref:hypothetical protein n=1 Tax=Corallococcus sp. NCRR TaxID=2996782 RepID=UPI001A8CA967|nr:MULTISPECIES: hypothetical protein [unclassified Corallococcus]MBN9685932.1 hypothetical protein [Corallococcus sp. NCSPR001]WAS82628.1 hypothetical protein O0N60_25270 [Corallococcus sp. NCRR]
MKPEPTEALHLLFDEQGQRVGDMPPVKCGLCGALARARTLASGMLHGDAGWDCPCGARGVRVELVDLDEVYPDVLEAWGLKPADPALAPPEPVGESGLLFTSHVDGHGLRTQLFEEARRQGAQVAASQVRVRITTPRQSFPDWTWDVLWARPFSQRN